MRREIAASNRSRADRQEASIEPWNGLQGPIDEPLLMRATAELTRPIYCVAGPPAMAEGLRLTLGDAGVADDAIRSEEFYGY